MGMDNSKEHSRSSAQRELGLVTEVSQHAALVFQKGWHEGAGGCGGEGLGETKTMQDSDDTWL